MCEEVHERQVRILQHFLWEVDKLLQKFLQELGKIPNYIQYTTVKIFVWMILLNPCKILTKFSCWERKSHTFSSPLQVWTLATKTGRTSYMYMCTCGRGSWSWGCNITIWVQQRASCVGQPYTTYRESTCNHDNIIPLSPKLVHTLK